MPGVHDRDSIRNRKSFLLIVSDIERGLLQATENQAKFLQQPFP